MRLLKILLFSIVAMGMVTTSASALVTVDHSTTAGAGPLLVGQSFDVDVNVTWDGAGALIGVFSSTQWDNTQLQLTNVVFPPAPGLPRRPVLLANGAYYPGMGQLGTIAAGLAGDDLTSLARTVQYATGAGAINAGNAATQIITRLTFLIIGVGDGIANVDGIFAVEDNGATGDAFAFGSQVAVTIVPEPGTALLMGLGLAGLAGAGRRTV